MRRPGWGHSARTAAEPSGPPGRRPCGRRFCRPCHRPERPARILVHGGEAGFRPGLAGRHGRHGECRWPLTADILEVCSWTKTIIGLLSWPNFSLMDDNLHSPQRRLIELRMEHADLDCLIDQTADERPSDELVLRRLKKRRLTLRDQITRLEIQ